MNAKKYYFDTSIWLDFLEERDEPHFLKSTLIRQLIEKIVLSGDHIIVSDMNMMELEKLGYTHYELAILFDALRPLIIFIESSQEQLRRARDLAHKRAVPKADALHALLAREYSAFFIASDAHFKQLTDIVRAHRVEEFL